MRTSEMLQNVVFFKQVLTKVFISTYFVNNIDALTYLVHKSFNFCVKIKYFLLSSSLVDETARAPFLAQNTVFTLNLSTFLMDAKFCRFLNSILCCSYTQRNFDRCPLSSIATAWTIGSLRLPQRGLQLLLLSFVTSN